MTKIEEISGWLEDHERRLREIEALLKTSSQPPKALVKSSSLNELAKKSKVSEEDLRSIFDFEEESLSLIKRPSGTEREATHKSALLVLFAYKYYFGQDAVLSSEIKRNVVENHIAVNNFAGHLNVMVPGQIRRIGKARSTSVKYKLTLPGEVKAKGLLVELISEGE